MWELRTYPYSSWLLNLQGLCKAIATHDHYWYEEKFIISIRILSSRTCFIHYFLSVFSKKSLSLYFLTFFFLLIFFNFYSQIYFMSQPDPLPILPSQSLQHNTLKYPIPSDRLLWQASHKINKIGLSKCSKTKAPSHVLRLGKVTQYEGVKSQKLAKESGTTPVPTVRSPTRGPSSTTVAYIQSSSCAGSLVVSSSLCKSLWA